MIEALAPALFRARGFTSLTTRCAVGSPLASTSLVSTKDSKRIGRRVRRLGSRKKGTSEVPSTLLSGVTPASSRRVGAMSMFAASSPVAVPALIPGPRIKNGRGGGGPEGGAPAGGRRAAGAGGAGGRDIGRR